MALLDTPRLHLRPLDAGDEAVYCRLYCDPGLMRHIAPPLAPDAARRSFAVACRLQRPRAQRWIALARAGAAPVGLVALVDRGESCAEPGVMLLAAWHGQGLATEAMAAVRDHGFGTLRLARMRALQQDPANLAVLRLMPRLGFRRAIAHPPPGVLWEMERGEWAGPGPRAGGDAADGGKLRASGSGNQG